MTNALAYKQAATQDSAQHNTASTDTQARYNNRV